MRFTMLVLVTFVVSVLALPGCGDSDSPTVGYPDDDNSPLCEGKADDPFCPPSEGEGEGETDAGTDDESDTGDPAEDAGSDPQSDAEPVACPADPILAPGMTIYCWTEEIPCVLWQDPVSCRWACGDPPDGKRDQLFAGSPQARVLRVCTLGGVS